MKKQFILKITFAAVLSVSVLSLVCEATEDLEFGVVSAIKNYPEFKRGFDPWANFSGTVQESVDSYTGKLTLTFQLPGIPFSEKAAFAPTLMYNSNIWGIRQPSWQTGISGGEFKVAHSSGEKDDPPPPLQEERPEVYQLKVPEYFGNDSWLRFSPIGQPHNMPGWSLPLGGIYTERTKVFEYIGSAISNCEFNAATFMTKKYFVSTDGSTHLLVDLQTNCRPTYGSTDTSDECSWLCVSGQLNPYCFPDNIQPGDRDIWRAVDGSGYYYIESMHQVFAQDGTRYDLYSYPDLNDPNHKYDGMIRKITDPDGNWIQIDFYESVVDSKDCIIYSYSSSTGSWMEIIFEHKSLVHYVYLDSQIVRSDIDCHLLYKIRYPSVNDSNIITYKFGYEPMISYLQTGITLPNGLPLKTEFNDGLTILNDGELTFGDIFANPDFSCGDTDLTLSNDIFCHDAEPAGIPDDMVNKQIFLLTSITLPDGVLPDGSVLDCRTFRFMYNHSGKISHILYPDGGYRRYDYGNTAGRNFSDVNTCDPQYNFFAAIGGESALGGVSRVFNLSDYSEGEQLERQYAYSGYFDVFEFNKEGTPELQETLSWFADGSVSIHRYFPVVESSGYGDQAVITDYGLPRWETGKMLKTISYQKLEWSSAISEDPIFKYGFLRISDETGSPKGNLSESEYTDLRSFVLNPAIGERKPLLEEETVYENQDNEWTWEYPPDEFCSTCNPANNQGFCDEAVEYYNYIIPALSTQDKPEWNTVILEKITRVFDPDHSESVIKKTVFTYQDVSSQPDGEGAPAWIERKLLLEQEEEYGWSPITTTIDWHLIRYTKYDYLNFWPEDYSTANPFPYGALPGRLLGIPFLTRVYDAVGNLQAATWNSYPAPSSENTNGTRFHPEWIYQLKVKNCEDIMNPYTAEYPSDNPAWTRTMNSYSVITVNGSNLVRLAATQAYDLTTLQNTVMFNYDSDGLLQSARIFDSGSIERQYMLTEYHPLTGLLLRRTDQNGDRNMSYYIEESYDDYLLLKYDIYNRPSEVILKHKNGSSAEQLTLTTYEYPLTTPYTVKRYDYIDNDIRTTTVENDGLGRAAVTRASLNSGTESYSEKQFDVLGRVQFEPYPTEVPVGAKHPKSDPLGITHIYDDLGREVETQKPGLGGTKTTTSSFIEYGVDSNTLCTTEKIIDEAGRYRLLYKDGLGRLVRVDEPDPAGGVLTTTYSYDVLDNLTQVNQGQQVRTFTYNALGQLLAATLPEYNNATMTYTYDDLGNLTGKFLGGDYTETLSYDDLGRLIARQTTLEGIRVDYAYEYDVCTEPMPAGFTASPDYNFGRLVRDNVTYPDNTYIERFFAYDWRGLPAQKGERFGQTGGSDVEFLTEYRAYDAQGNLQTMIYPSGQRVDLSYGAHGLLSGLQWNAADVMDTIRYAPHGAPQEAHAYGFDGGEIVWRQDFNDRRWPAAIYTDDYSTLLKEPTERTLLELAYQYENNGNITQIDRKYRSVFTGSASYESVLRFDYRYDSLNRLCWAKFDDITHPDTFYGEYEYLMDRYGNISDRNLLSGKGTDPAPPPTISFIIDPDTNRFTDGAQKYTNDDYDVLGNLLWSGTPNESLNLEYMDQGHICRAVDGTSGDEWRYYYDADGKRRIKAMGASGIFDNVSFYFYEGENLICQQDLGAALQDPAAYDTKFLLVDHLGTTRADLQFLEDQGLQVPTIVKTYDFMPYGEELAPEVIPVEDVKFTGKQRDDETQLDFFGARFYRSSMGRFTSADPLLASGQTSDPQSFNRYSYCANNPIRLFDPTGLWEIRQNRVEKKDKNGKVIKVTIYLTIVASKAGDNAATLAQQLRKAGDKKFISKLEKMLAKDPNSIDPTKLGGHIGRVFKQAEKGLSIEADANNAGSSTNYIECSRTAAIVNFPNFYEHFTGQKADLRMRYNGWGIWTTGQLMSKALLEGSWKESSMAALVSGDLIQWGQGTGAHFANFLMMEDNGDHRVFSKTGKGPFEITTVNEMNKKYGTISTVLHKR